MMRRMATKKSLTPAELFDYRLAALHGFLDIDQMKRSMTQRSYLGWRRYWDEEPWGPWRDNMHTAILAREIRRTRVRSNVRIELEQFLMRAPKSRKKEAEVRVFSGLAAAATVVTAAEAARRIKIAKASRNRIRSKASNRRRSETK